MFSVFAVLCAAVFFCGIITVREKTRYNMDMTPYAEIQILESPEGIIIVAGEREIKIEREKLEQLKSFAFSGFTGDRLTALRELF